MLIGAASSPYTRKVLSALRFRRLPHRFIIRDSDWDTGLPSPPGPRLLPNIVYEDGTPDVDSTPMLRELERRFPDFRSIIPQHEGLRFLNNLIEDYADEWCTKLMFYHRWYFEADALKASRCLPMEVNPGLDPSKVQEMASYVGKRQTERLGSVVGGNAVTAPAIEVSYKNTLFALADHLASGKKWILGNRPSSCDFALYGQLTQLVLFDPTSTALAEDLAPRVVAWTRFMEDLSGVEPMHGDQWDIEVSPTLKAFLSEIGRMYAPFMVANHDAVTIGQKQVQCTLDGKPWEQASFKYQAKCLRVLRQEYASLSANARAYVDEALAGTGCEVMFLAAAGNSKL